MHFIDGDRGVGRLAPGARRHPGVVLPDMDIDRRNDGRGRRRHFRCARDRVGLLRQQVAAGRQQLELVALAHADARDEHFPDAGLVAQPHRMATAIPQVEVAHHRHPLRGRRPHCKTGAGNAGYGHRLGAQAAAQTVMHAARQQAEFMVAQQQAERVRVFGLVNGFIAFVIGPPDAQPVSLACAHARRRPGEHAALVHAGQVAQHAAAQSDRLHPVRARLPGADLQLASDHVRPEQAERVLRAAVGQRVDQMGGDVAFAGRGRGPPFLFNLLLHGVLGDVWLACRCKGGAGTLY